MYFKLKILIYFKIRTLISFFRSLLYLSTFLIFLVTVLSLSGSVNIKNTNQTSFRIMTYNIHHGEGIDGVIDLNRIANVIKKENPDILLLQEVDVNLDRSGNIDIAQQLSKSTGLKNTVFGKNLDIEKGSYGNAILTRYPITTSKNFQFKQIGPEQRGVLVTELSVEGRILLVMNSHFDHSEDDSERILYAKKIINDILPEYNSDAVLIGGDFNDIPTSPMYQKLSEHFKDVWVVSGEGNTIPADQPSKRIDYILFKGSIKPVSSWVPQTEASDHLPVVSDFFWVDEE